MKDVYEVSHRKQRKQSRRRDRFARLMLDVGRAAGRQMRRDRADMMAAALTYRVLFALIPLMVIAVSVLQFFVTPDDVKAATQELVEHLQLDAIEVQDQRTSTDGGSARDQQFTLGSWLVGMAAGALDYDTSGLTILGGIILLYSAIYLFREIERSFSVVSGRGSRRKWWNRWGMYLVVLFLGPVVVVAALWLMQWGSSTLVEVGGRHLVLVAVVQHVITIVLIWGLVVVGYLFIPARRQAFRAVATGAAFATFCLVIARYGFQFYVERAVVGSPAGSLGLVPLFLFWLYLNWLCLLFGLQFAAVMSRVTMLRHGRRGVS